MIYNIIIKVVTTRSAEYPQVWQLREDELRKPLGLSLKDEDLSGDEEDIIIAALLDGNVIGCVMLHAKDNGVMKLRQMAVASNKQNKGIGRMLVTAAEKKAAEKGFSKMDMHARQTAVGFYEKLGYTVTSGVFTEVGIPHLVMEKQLDQ